jgi:serine/threonine protein kinase
MSLENTLINTENDFAIIKDKLVNELLNLSKNNEINIYDDEKITLSVDFNSKDIISQQDIDYTLNKYYRLIDYWPNKKDKVGKCIIHNLIGKGQTSNVYHATHEFLGIDVALKILSEEFKLTDTNIETMFLQEAKHLAKLNHKNLVSIFDAEKNDKYTYIVMEHIDGVNLNSIVEKEKKVTVHHAVEIMLNLADVLEYALENNIIHRDIKPGNIMVSKEGRVKLLDLGLSIILANNDSETDGLIGTPHYMSPEQIISPNNIDHRADLYSLGATFYHLLTGKPVFDTNCIKALIKKSLDSDYEKEIDFDILDSNIRTILEKLLKKDPDNRIQTYSELKKELFNLKKLLMTKSE